MEQNIFEQFGPFGWGGELVGGGGGGGAGVSVYFLLSKFKIKINFVFVIFEGVGGLE